MCYLNFFSNSAQVQSFSSEKLEKMVRFFLKHFAEITPFGEPADPSIVPIAYQFIELCHKFRQYNSVYFDRLKSEQLCSEIKTIICGTKNLLNTLRKRDQNCQLTANLFNLCGKISVFAEQWVEDLEDNQNFKLCCFKK